MFGNVFELQVGSCHTCGDMFPIPVQLKHHQNKHKVADVAPLVRSAGPWDNAMSECTECNTKLTFKAV